VRNLFDQIMADLEPHRKPSGRKIGQTFSETLTIPCPNGVGQYSYDFTSLWADVDFTASAAGPLDAEGKPDGTWSIVVNVAAPWGDPQTIFQQSGMVAGQSYAFSHQFGARASVSITATWSKQQTTSLPLLIVANY
jgi:hypothetical protein